MTNLTERNGESRNPVPFNEAAGRTVSALSSIETLILRRNVVVEAPPPIPASFGTARRRFYARFSTPDQKIVSIHRQVGNCLRYIRTLGRGDDYKLHEDQGISAKQVFTRDGLLELLRDVEAGLVDDIVVEDFDRLSREIYDAAEIAELLEKHKVALHCATHGRRLSKQDQIEAAIRAERDRLRRATVCWSGRMQAALEGSWPGNWPFGYRRSHVKGHPDIHEENAETIRIIFDLAADGVSPRTIVRHLISENRVGPSGSVKWSVATVYNILDRPLYAGIVVFGRLEVQGDRRTKKRTRRDRPVEEISRSRNEAFRIVSDEVFERVQRRRRGPLGQRGEHVLNLLTNRVRCDCEEGAEYSFVIAPTRVSCGRQIADGGCPCKPWSMPRADVEAAVVRAVGEKLRSEVEDVDFAQAYARKLREAADLRRQERKRHEAKLTSLDGDLDRLLMSALRENFEQERVANMAALLREEKRALEYRLEDMQALDVAEANAGPALVDLASAIDDIAVRLPFKPTTVEDEVFLQAMRRVVKRVEWRREGVSANRVRLDIHVDFAAHVLGDDEPGTTSEVISVDLEIYRSPVRQAHLRAEAKKLREGGEHRLSDAHWSALAPLLPDANSMRKAARRVETRDVVDALMLNLRTGIKIITQSPIHPPYMGDAIRRFVYAGGDRVLLEGLARLDPGLVEGLDLRALELAPTFIKVPPERRRSECRRRAHELDGSTALTNAQWRLSEHLIHPGTELSKQGKQGLPARLMIEATLLKFRARCNWADLPARFGGQAMLRASFRRLLGTKTWDKLLASWAATCPELVKDLDTSPMHHRKRRGSDGAEAA